MLKLPYLIKTKDPAMGLCYAHIPMRKTTAFIITKDKRGETSVCKYPIRITIHP